MNTCFIGLRYVVLVTSHWSFQRSIGGDGRWPKFVADMTALDSKQEEAFTVIQKSIMVENENVTRFALSGISCMSAGIGKSDLLASPPTFSSPRGTGRNNKSLISLCTFHLLTSLLGRYSF